MHICVYVCITYTCNCVYVHIHTYLNILLSKIKKQTDEVIFEDLISAELYALSSKSSCTFNYPN